VGYTRETRQLSALSITKTYVAAAPPPASVLVLPAGTRGLRNVAHELDRDAAAANVEAAKAGVERWQREVEERVQRERERRRQAEKERQQAAERSQPEATAADADLCFGAQDWRSHTIPTPQTRVAPTPPPTQLAHVEQDPACGRSSCFADTQLAHIHVRGREHDQGTSRLAMAQEHQKRAQHKLEYARRQHEEGERPSKAANSVCAQAHQRISMMEALADLPLSRGARARGRVSAVEPGDRDAQLEYGLRLLAGRGVDRRRTLAVSYLTRASEQGQALADCALAVCWALGEGVAYVDKRQAMTCLERALRAGIPLASALQADLLNAALDKATMLAKLDALRATLTVDTPIACISKNMALNHLGELYAHAHDALPITRAAARGPPSLSGALSLASSMHALSTLEEGDGAAAAPATSRPGARISGEFEGEFQSGKVRVGGEEPPGKGRAWWEKPHPLPLSDSRAMRLFKASLSVPAGRPRFAPALNNLGEMHELGRHGRAPDEDQAYAYYKKAADAAALSTAKEERYMSNMRALPKHLLGLPAEDFGATDLVQEMERKLSISLGLPPQ
jgi:TPR repeat protein